MADCVCEKSYQEEATGQPAGRIPPHLVAAVGLRISKLARSSIGKEPGRPSTATNCFMFKVFDFYISTGFLCVLTVCVLVSFSRVQSLQFFCGSVDSTGRAWLGRITGNTINLRGTL